MTTRKSFEKQILPWGNVQGIRLPKAACKKLFFEPGEELMIDVAPSGVYLRKPTKMMWQKAVLSVQGRVLQWGNSLGVQLTGAARMVPQFNKGDTILLELDEDGIFVMK